MAVTSTVHCDRCGEVVTADLVRLRRVTGDEFVEFDLHRECYAAFKAWLAAGKEKA